MSQFVRPVIAIGVDIGGSHISAVALQSTASSAGDAICHSTRTVTLRYVDVVIDLILQCIYETYSQLCSKFEDFIIVGIGLGVPGNVDPQTGTTRYLPNFGWLSQVPLRDLLLDELLSAKHSKFGHIDKETFKIVMRNDGRCAAIAEYTFGSGRGQKVFAMLTLGTGIGGALISDGRLFDGSSFDAGDFGHHVIRSGTDALDCVCGKRGCFECHASAAGLVRQFNKRLRTRLMATNPHHTSNQTDAAVDAMMAQMKCENALCILKKMRTFYAMRTNGTDSDTNGHAADESLELSSESWTTYCDDLTTGLANLVTFYNPNVIALGGGLGQAREMYEEGTVQKQLDEKTLPATRGKAKVVRAELGNEAGMVGAALLALGRGLGRNED